LETRLRYATKVASYRIHELPPKPMKNVGITIDPCLTTKKLFNPLNIDERTTPPAGNWAVREKEREREREILNHMNTVFHILFHMLHN